MFFRYLSFVFTLAFTLSSTSYASTGAGALLFFDDGSVLLGKERRRNGYVWSEFGGKTDPRETRAQTGWREGNEETAGTLKQHLTLARVKQAEAKGHYVDHNHPRTGRSYRMYFIQIYGHKPSLATFHKNAASLKMKLGRNAHIEKDDWKYFDASVIMNAHKQNGNLPGTKEPVYRLLKACLRQPTAQQFFMNFINSVKKTPPIPQQKQVLPIGRKSVPISAQRGYTTRKPAPISRKTCHAAKKFAVRAKPIHGTNKRTICKRPAAWDRRIFARHKLKHRQALKRRRYR